VETATDKIHKGCSITFLFKERDWDLTHHCVTTVVHNIMKRGKSSK